MPPIVTISPYAPGHIEEFLLKSARISPSKQAVSGTAVVALHVAGEEFERATRRAGTAYRQAVASAQAPLTASGMITGWSMDKYDHRRASGKSNNLGVANYLYSCILE